MGITGLAATFLPEELLGLLDVTLNASLPILLQLLGALWFAFAMVNWTAKGNAIGGIYGRPIALGNLTHFVVGGLALVKGVMNGAASAPLVVLGVVYVVFAVAFAMVFFGGPVPPRNSIRTT